MKKLYKAFATVALLIVMALNPMSASANHGGDKWKTHYSYNQCISNNTYRVDEQHRHNGPNQELRTIKTHILNACIGQ